MSRKLRTAIQLLLPNMNHPNPEAGNAHVYENHPLLRKDGTPRTPRGIEQQLERSKPWTEEEKDTQEEYENGGEDRTGGTVYRSWFRNS